MYGRSGLLSDRSDSWIGFPAESERDSGMPFTAMRAGRTASGSRHGLGAVARPVPQRTFRPDRSLQGILRSSGDNLPDRGQRTWRERNYMEL